MIVFGYRLVVHSIFVSLACEQATGFRVGGREGGSPFAPPPLPPKKLLASQAKSTHYTTNRHGRQQSGTTTIFFSTVLFQSK